MEQFLDDMRAKMPTMPHKELVELAQLLGNFCYDYQHELERRLIVEENKERLAKMN